MVISTDMKKNEISNDKKLCDINEEGESDPNYIIEKKLLQQINQMSLQEKELLVK